MARTLAGRKRAALAAALTVAAALFVWVVMAKFHAAREAEALRLRTVQIAYNVPYRTVDGQTLALDVYAPPLNAGRGPFPVALLIHGGSWIEGNRNELRGYARALAERGIVAASADYRLLSRDGTRNRWPAQIDDVRAAVYFLRLPAQAARFHLFPKRRVGVMGHSSGAQMAALLGVQSPQTDGVGAVIDFAGPIDFTDAAHPPLLPQEMPLLLLLFGKTKAHDFAVYRDASPACVAAVSKEPSAPFLIFHGGSDPVVPLQQAHRMEAALRQKHRAVRLVVFPGEGHLFGKPENVRLWEDESAQFFRTNLP